VQWATNDGTAFEGVDYVSGQDTLSFPAGFTARLAGVQVVGDTVSEPSEFFFVNLANPTNATLADDEGRATILNDDG